MLIIYQLYILFLAHLASAHVDIMSRSSQTNSNSVHRPKEKISISDNAEPSLQIFTPFKYC